jgi:preprotein translocase subunit SecA
LKKVIELAKIENIGKKVDEVAKLKKWIEKIFGSYGEKEIKRLQPIIDQIEGLSEEYKKLSDEELRAKTFAFKERLKNGDSLNDILPEAFATVREASGRVLGMRHYPVQLVGGIVLHQGRIAEMKTGEGKTLVATLPAYLNALTGEGVHIVTVNDYLARRDSEWMGKVYRFLGLTVGLVTQDGVGGGKKEAYACDIVYGTNNEFGFDYLRDNMVIYKDNMVQRDHAFAIVDEVDSILIDEARTPLIISGQGERSTDLYVSVDRFVRKLKSFRIVESNDKELDDHIDADYIIDEKAKAVTLTRSGIKKAETAFGVENITDSEHMTLYHHINQSIRAHGIMTRDVDYVVKNGQVMIVDEFTGRLMIGRRFSEGLHQAIEAKEGVKVERESVTLATITFQNYFRLYKKLSGMTGTAKTEEQEFREIYNLDVIEIPTNRPMMREDYHDAVYRNEQGKFNAVIEQIEECHRRGQPVLVGTISIEKSEFLASMLKKRGIPHQVLNAKHHEKEAHIVAQAGQLGAVTIATNMAGRGTDIILGGNAEFMAKAQMAKEGYTVEMIDQAIAFTDTRDEEIMAARDHFKVLNEKYKAEISQQAEEVKKQGGLFIIGTERHESRRIDNQLRGRSGRQGDPGRSRFYISMEDDLMRLFGGDRISGVVDALGLEDDVPIEHRMLSRAIESAQGKVESRNFQIRKHVLQYDDVMNQQRELIYAQRKKVLDGEDLTDYIQKMIEETISQSVETFTGESSIPDNWDFAGLKSRYLGIFLTEQDLHYTVQDFDTLTKEDLKETLCQRAMEAYHQKEEAIGSELMRELERVVLLQVVDRKWMDHIDAMDQLRRGIGLRAYGQRDPVVEFKFEGFDMFDDMIESIKQDTVRYIFTANIKDNRAPQREQVAKEVAPAKDPGTATPVRKGDKIGRNDLCPCGSGKKYKKCCGNK